jgi:Rrf2 family protein
MTSRRELLAIAAVLDVALNARGKPVSSKALAERLSLPPRHLESLLRELVHARILKGMRGPRGGYELARERRRISVGEIVREMEKSADSASQGDGSRLLDAVVVPTIAGARLAFLRDLDRISIEDLVRRAEQEAVVAADADPGGFVI